MTSSWTSDSGDRRRQRSNQQAQKNRCYQGTTVISKNGGGYTLKWTIGSTGQTGTGILTHGAAKQKEDDLLSASFGARGHAFGVVVYRVKDDGRLVGKWLNPSGGSFGTETLTPR